MPNRLSALLGLDEDMNKKTITSIILFALSILVFTSPGISYSDSDIKIYRSYTFCSSLVEPLVIIDNEEKYNNFIDNSEIYELYGATDPLYEHTPFKHPQIDFKNQCLALISAPSVGSPLVKNISYDKKAIIIDVEYSESLSWEMGICGTAILIDRPNTTITLSQNSLSEYERFYGKKIQCINNSLNHIVDKDVMDIWKKIVINMINDISKLKRHFRELKKFDEDSVYRNHETNEVIGIADSNKRYFLVIEIEHPLKPPIQLGAITGPAYTYRIWEKEFENICVTVEARMDTSNKKLKKEILEIIKKRIAPLDKLNNGAN